MCASPVPAEYPDSSSQFNGALPALSEVKMMSYPLALTTCPEVTEKCTHAVKLVCVEGTCALSWLRVICRQ